MDTPEATILEVMQNPPEGHSRGVLFLGWLYLKVTPKDRPAPEEVKGVTPVMPGPKNLKDIIGGVPGVVKGIVVDNVLPIYGAQPLSSGDQPKQPDYTIEDAGLAVVNALRSNRYKITEIDDWPSEVRHQFLARLQSDARLRASVASTVEGRALLKAREIRLTQEDETLAAALQMKRETAPKKKGGGNPILPVVNAAGNAVVNAITQLDQLFAANPPDP